MSSVLKAGQYLPVRILSATQDDEACHLSLSTNPGFVNKDFGHQMFKKGMLVWAAIAEQLEHGYSLDIGVPHVRVFLPNKNVDEGNSYGEFICTFGIFCCTSILMLQTITNIYKHKNC